MTEIHSPVNVIETAYLRLDDGHTQVRAEVPTLDSDILVRIKQDDSPELVIPMRVAMALNYKIFPPIAQVVWPIQNRARRDFNHPTKYLDLLMMDPSDKEGNHVILPKEFAREFGVPVIHWNEDGMGASQTNGWQLSLSAFAWLNLGFADWNDEEGIKALVSQMMDVESLNITAALIAPESTATLIVLQAQVDFVTGNC